MPISTAALRSTNPASAGGIRVAPVEAGGIVNRRNVGMLMAILGSALGAWWAVQQRGRAWRGAAGQAHDRGTVIFDNTPRASNTDAVV